MNLKILAKVIEAIDEESGSSAAEIRNAIVNKLGNDAPQFFNSTPLDLIKMVGSATFGAIFDQLIELQKD